MSIDKRKIKRTDFSVRAREEEGGVGIRGHQKYNIFAASFTCKNIYLKNHTH